MEFLIWILLGIFATWRITFDMTSSLELDGPFALYRLIRKLGGVQWVPDFFKEGLDCPYCVSFVVGHLIAILLPVYDGFTGWRIVAVFFVVSWGISGAVTWYYRRMVAVYGIDSRDV